MVALFADPLPEVVLRGPRIYLRPPRRGDYRGWTQIRERSRDFLVPWEPSWPEDALSRSCFRRRLRRAVLDWREDQGYAFHILHRPTNSPMSERLLGGIGLSHVRRGVSQTASVGYWLGADYARLGFMSEALACLIDFAFEDLLLHRLEAACLPRNKPSHRLLVKCGFREEGLARRYLKINGVWEDHLFLSLLREDLGR